MISFDPTLRERIEGGLLGLLVGDALGVPYEFHAPGEIPTAELIEFDPPAGFRRAHLGVRPGTWSDDGAQALCLLASLLACEGFDAHDFARRMSQWHNSGYMAVGGHVFDIGITTANALANLRAGVAPLDAGLRGEYDNGNGSLMRALPLALWHVGGDADLVRDARLQSRVTHGHARSQACCALYVLWARRVLQGVPDPWGAAVAWLRAHWEGDAEMTHELETEIRPDDPPGGYGSGYVLDALCSARWAVEQGPYEVAVKAAVAMGNDTDTTACIAGGIAGLRDGVQAIPVRWRDDLRGLDIVQPLLERLLRLHGSGA